MKRLLNKLFSKKKKQDDFTTSPEYWEKRYEKGGNSGAGSYNNLAEFKAEVLNDFVESNAVNSVIEFGSGDGNQLKYFNFKSYLGYDISSTAVDLCNNLYKDDATKNFDVVSNFSDAKADLVLSLDVIYHLVEDATFDAYMKNLFKASKKHVIIYSSNTDVYNKAAPVDHVRHRKFTNWIKTYAADFKQTDFIPNKFPFDGNNDNTSHADFYMFSK